MCKVMGIVNITPDSFSDGGKYFTPEEAVRRVNNLLEEGANIIDLGAESTRPGATPLSWSEEWERLEPVLKLLMDEGKWPKDRLLSIDTYHPETAERALKAGALMINCVYAQSALTMIELCASNSVALVLPACVKDDEAIVKVLSRKLEQPTAFSLYLDPMIGFGTTREEDLARLRSVSELAKQSPILVGASRKRIIKKLTGEKMTGKNLGGSLGVAVWAAMNGASIVRVHDVRETVQALKVIAVLQS